MSAEMAAVCRRCVNRQQHQEAVIDVTEAGDWAATSIRYGGTPDMHACRALFSLHSMCYMQSSCLNSAHLIHRGNTSNLSAVGIDMCNDGSTRRSGDMCDMMLSVRKR
jgi:hypothetical protein